MEGVYLLHFNKEVVFPKPNRYGDSKHYIGASTQIEHRLNQHEQGEGAQMTKAAKEQGIEMTIAAIFPVGLVKVEQHLTRVGAKSLCPICIMSATPNLAVAQRTGPTKVFKIKEPTTCVQCSKDISTGTTVHLSRLGVRCYYHQAADIAKKRKSK